MYKIILSILLAMLITGCTSVDSEGNKEFDPVNTGEIIGFTYLMTKAELSESDRENVEKAYEVFTAIVTSDIDLSVSVDLQALLYAELDKRINDSPETKVAIKVILSRYWDRVNTKYNVSLKLPADQLAIMKQVRLGIERGLGRGEV